jgi:hypothetical protein
MLFNFLTNTYNIDVVSEIKKKDQEEGVYGLS